MFCVLEGFDRVGKNTQAALLARRLAGLGLRVAEHTTPDYSLPSGELLRRWLRRQVDGMDRMDDADNARVLQCLASCNRREVASLVERRLREGTSVVCVRWHPSALIYGEVDGIDREESERLCAGLPRPDLLVLLDAGDDVRTRLDRSSRYERDPVGRELVIERYRQMWRQEALADPGRWVVVSAPGPAEEVARRVWNEVEKWLLTPGSKPGIVVG